MRRRYLPGGEGRLDGAVRCARDDPGELAAAMLGVLGDTEAADRLAQRGAAYVRERYSWARTARRTLTAYADAARPRPAAR
ncbi:hypothetical protein [Microbispora sp. NPDC046933]|uniref:hypothetical protein n=1 Tax=Microbispora sp. NPDC046933 TaxID=3155618 RepID=UPI0033CC9EBA